MSKNYISSVMLEAPRQRTSNVNKIEELPTAEQTKMRAKEKSKDRAMREGDTPYFQKKLQCLTLFLPVT